jgi:hypothetical protein
MSLPFLWIIAVHFNVIHFEVYAMSQVHDFRLPPEGLENCAFLGYFTYLCAGCNKGLRISLPLNALFHSA